MHFLVAFGGLISGNLTLQYFDNIQFLCVIAIQKLWDFFPLFIELVFGIQIS